MKASSYVANFDSASGFLRALGRYLHGRDFPSTGMFWARPERMARLLNRLPRGAKESLYSSAGITEAISPRRLHRVSSEEMARWVLSQYPRRQHPAVMIGSSSGAIMHLCAALQIPWLPQTFLIPVRDSTHPDEPRRGLIEGERWASRLLRNNPDLQLHHMQDASQDRLMLSGMAYFRVKRRRLGETFERYLEETLPPGGTIFLVECRRSWPGTRLSTQHVFQHGALGGTEPDEFIHGSERVEEYLHRYGSHRRRWDSPQPNGEWPEAEWGFEPALRDDVEFFARRRGYKVRQIVFEEPEHPSPLVAELYRWWYARRRIHTSRLVVECFVEVEPHWVLRTGSVPFWLKFGMEPSSEWLERYLDRFGTWDEIRLMLFNHGVENPGLAPIERWKSILARARRTGAFLGVTEEKFPQDFASFVRYHTDLRRIPARYPMPGPLTLGQLDAFLAEQGDRFPVEWNDLVSPSYRGIVRPREVLPEHSPPM